MTPVDFMQMEENYLSKVSVIIPIYNSEQFLEETIKTVLHQDYKNIELILVDDGSTDGSLQIAKKYESDKVTVLHQLNQGACVARNLGLEHATGIYIQFMDADDLLSSSKIWPNELSGRMGRRLYIQLPLGKIL